MEEALAKVAEELHFPLHNLKLVVSLFAAYPLGIIRRWLPNATSRQVFDLLCGLLFAWFAFGVAMVHSVITASVTYILLLLAPNTPVVVFAFNMMYLAGCHAYRQYYNLDIIWDGSLMVQTFKLASLAFNCADGRRDPQKLTADQMRMRLDRVPGVLPYSAYVYFFGGFLVGPFFEMKQYLFLCSLVDDRGEQVPRPSAGRVLAKFAIGMVCMGATLLGDAVPVAFLTSSKYLESPLLYRIGYAWIAVLMYRFKYYFVWSHAEGACMAAGLGYNGVDKTTGAQRWDLMQNADPVGVELALNMKGAIDRWNIATARFLNRYVYQRMSAPGKKPTVLNTVATFAVSAVWHGFYPGYYAFFLSGPLFINVGRELRRRVRPMFVTKDADGQEKAKGGWKRAYDVAGIVLTSAALQYIGISFELQDLDKFLPVYKSLYFGGHIAAAVALVLLKVSGGRRQSPKLVQKVK